MDKFKMYEQLITRLENFTAASSGCKKIYCSTCGGLAAAVESNMTGELDGEIKLTLSKLSLKDFVGLGEWSWFFYCNYSNDVNLILKREEEKLDIADIQALDNYLLKARHFGRQETCYNKLFKIGVAIAVTGANDSLLETIAIVLEKKLIDHKQLFELAMQKIRTNKNIHRVLYNNFREEIPEVRGYIGDGTSVPSW